ncbi:hypothetical protein IKB17_00930 [bacterium]|nr:hypothetical protein [bacterium]
MKEHDFIKIIEKETCSPYLGDDCAYLKDLNIVVTQDNFIEDVHFKRDWATPYQIGYKAAAVNISDILASGAKPKYISVGLSLPNTTEEYFKKIYKGIKDGAFGAEIIGGDITYAEKIMISITAIGTTKDRKISSRKNAKEGYVIISNSNFGISSEGLKQLKNGMKNTREIKTHLEPILDFNFSEEISTQILDEYAMMDTSDGLADALFQIAKASHVKITTSFIPGMFGAEDYNLVAAVPQTFLKKLSSYKIIGTVSKFDGFYLEIDNKSFSDYNELGLFNHFGD